MTCPFFMKVFAAAVFRCSEATALVLLSARKRAGACPRASFQKATVISLTCKPLRWQRQLPRSYRPWGCYLRRNRDNSLPTTRRRFFSLYRVSHPSRALSHRPSPMKRIYPQRKTSCREQDPFLFQTCSIDY